MNTTVLSLLVLFTVALVIAAGFVGLSAIIGRRKGAPDRYVPYECGLDPIGEPRHRASVKYFLIAVQFIIFDIEVVFLYPWARVHREFVAAGLGTEMLLKMLLFMGILVFGLIYVWGRGALEWEE